MKKVFISLLLFLVLVSSYLGLGPFLALYSIKESIEAKDSNQLSKNIYFPELRANLKDQINLSFSDSINKRLNDNPLRFLAEGLADIVVDETLDVFLTPDGLGRLMDGEDPSSIIRNNKKSEKKDSGVEVLESIEFKYQSMNRFIVFINTVNKKQIRLHLDRFGIRWKLVNVILP
ncbi:MAG: hypothetical protein CMC12_02265 [Flavobacteriaceae bacterium]|nr:hypothetical protein [Flavobacteriaceae bacterium]|tara:strand:+ start:5487 stop:6011 length:525 start_codon:yes stop_codon:yes gene_type:complete